MLRIAASPADGAAAPSGSEPQPDPGPVQGAASVESPEAAAVRLIRTTSTWLIGALAAIGAVLGAGITFSNVGRLEWGQDSLRLAVAGVSAAVAFTGLVAAIVCLVRLQYPVTAGLPDVETAAREDGTLDRFARADRGNAAGFEDARALLSRYRELRELVWRAEARERAASRALEALQDPSPEESAAARGAVAAAHAVVVAETSRTQEEYDRLAKVILRLTERRQLELLEESSRRWVARAVLASLTAALGIVVFAWAGNPPEDRPGADRVLQARPTSAVLRATEAGLARYGGVLPEPCLARAADPGIPVVALDRVDDGVEVVTVPSTACPEPVRLIVLEDLGALVPDDPVRR